MSFRSFIRDRLVRRFISASFFAAAFVWVAVRYFNVETEDVWRFLGLSFAMVGLMIAAGLVGALLLRGLRRQPLVLPGDNGQAGSEDSGGESSPGHQGPGSAGS